MKIKFDYYFGKEAEAFSFFRIPKLLFTDEIFSKLSSDAKVLYGILLDRMSLSRRNGWIDDSNRVYIIFTIEEIAEVMCCATQKATKILQELDSNKGIGLVEKRRLGLGKPNILYVKNFVVDDMNNDLVEKSTNQELLKSQNQNDENHNSRNVIITNQELLKSQCNNTNINKTDCSDTDINNTSSKDVEEKSEITNELKEQVCFSYFENSIKDKERVELIVKLMAEVIENKADVRINKSNIPYEKAKEKFKSIRREHIEYLLAALDSNTQQIINYRAYLLSLIYNSTTNYLGLKKGETKSIDYSKDQEIWQNLLK